jgi:hypothetical protein
MVRVVAQRLFCAFVGARGMRHRAAAPARERNMPEIRTDFSQPACVTPAEFQWIPSPEPGVERVMLDRIGDEVAVATSLVRYGPGAKFGKHEHAFGEEFLVLDGEFGDEHGRYPAFTYVRNPPGSGHSPFAEPGCVIFVKLRQFDITDQRQAVVRLDDPIPAAGCAVRELHRFGDEAVDWIGVATGASWEVPAGERVQEVLVADGEFTCAGRTLGPWSWLRLPVGQGATLHAIRGGRLLHKVRPAVALTAL